MSEMLEQDTGFRVTDDASAEWCLKKIMEAKADVQRWSEFYAEQMKKIKDCADSTIAYFEAKLEEYFESVPHKATKTQESYTLPSGKLVRKQRQPQFDTNDEALVPWLEMNDMSQFVKVKKSADWAALKKQVIVRGDCVVTADGEIIPGIAVTERPDEFRVEVEG